jgi:hypothetical protein
MARGKKPKGLGDVIENITEATGIKKAVEKFSEITGIDCGCDERKKYLNEKYPIGARVRQCLKDEDKEYLTKFFSVRHENLYPLEQRELARIYESVYQIRIENSNCGSCWREYVNNLKKLID